MSTTAIAPKKLLLRCLAFERKGYWLAMCVDLDLAVQADTLPKAKRLLREQMHSYIDDVLSVDNQHAGDLLTRKAPMRYVALYHFIKLTHAAKRMLSYETTMPMKLTHA
jgi:hypothetical protein